MFLPQKKERNKKAYNIAKRSVCCVFYFFGTVSFFIQRIICIRDDQGNRIYLYWKQTINRFTWFIWWAPKPKSAIFFPYLKEETHALLYIVVVVVVIAEYNPKTPSQQKKKQQQHRILCSEKRSKINMFDWSKYFLLP